MRKSIKAIVSFVAIMALLLYGRFYGDTYVIRATAGNILGLARFKYSFFQVVENLNSIYNENTRYHGELMDINSLYLRYSGATTVKKDESTTVLRLDNGLLTTKAEYFTDEQIVEGVSIINELYQYVQNKGVDFLYVACPVKGYYSNYPEGIENYVPTNCNRFYHELSMAEIPTLNLTEELKEDEMSEADAFYITDHHWKTQTGLWATGKICEELFRLYGYSYNEEYTNISNYNISVYNNWFLGSQGKKVGAYFSELGVDDFTLITPEFETNFVEEQPYKNETRSGNFVESLLFMDKVNEMNWYLCAPYSTYCGGDFRLQIFNNKLAENNRKVLLIRDSFADVVAPFLALQNETVYITDVRNYEHLVGEKPNIYELIEEINPDCVIVLYTDAVRKGSAGRLDFD